MSDEPTREQELEEALKDMLYYLELHATECEEKGINGDPTDWAWNIKHMLESRLGREHSGYVGWDHEFVLKCWLVIEVWKDGRIMPRCIALTEKRAEQAKDMIEYSYERKEPKNRPKISIEHQRLNHIFGFSMLGRKYLGLYELK